MPSTYFSPQQYSISSVIYWWEEQQQEHIHDSCAGGKEEEEEGRREEEKDAFHGNQAPLEEAMCTTDQLHAVSACPQLQESGIVYAAYGHSPWICILSHTVLVLYSPPSLNTMTEALPEP